MDSEVTAILSQYRAGDQEAFDKLFKILYRELRVVAAGLLRRESAKTLQPTMLVHETYFKLLAQSRIAFQNRSQFFALAATVMRRILVDAARARRATKRGGDWQRDEFTERLLPPQQSDEKIIALDDALTHFAMVDSRATEIVEMRYFGGYENEEIATTLNISVATVKRDLAFAKSWLFQEMKA